MANLVHDDAGIAARLSVSGCDPFRFLRASAQAGAHKLLWASPLMPLDSLWWDAVPPCPYLERRKWDQPLINHFFAKRRVTADDHALALLRKAYEPTTRRAYPG
jgi:hypothetical protein